jgi:hypothetical protein
VPDLLHHHFANFPPVAVELSRLGAHLRDARALRPSRALAPDAPRRAKAPPECWDITPVTVSARIVPTSSSAPSKNESIAPLRNGTLACLSAADRRGSASLTSPVEPSPCKVTKTCIT